MLKLVQRDRGTISTDRQEKSLYTIPFTSCSWLSDPGIASVGVSRNHVDTSWNKDLAQRPFFKFHFSVTFNEEDLSNLTRERLSHSENQSTKSSSTLSEIDTSRTIRIN